jgi:two-component system chemotaxis response regulator CheB
MRVVVVDDSAFMRRAITQMLASDPDIQVVASARNGREGVDAVKQFKPDVVTMDIEMPEMDGLTALQTIMRDCPTHVIMLSSLTTEGSHAALRAMSLGAADFLAKDTSQISLSITNIQSELLAKVRALGGSVRHRKPVAVAAPQFALDAVPKLKAASFDVICIGSSTGGPPVLETIIRAVPATLRLPVVIAQHMPAVFTASMSERLHQISAIPVVHVADNMPLERGRVHICPGAKHTHIERIGLGRWKLRVNDEPASAPYRPSVDALFMSAASAMGSRVLGIVLTGMGNDGFEGGRLLHARGATLIAQNSDSCVVYGMPKGITENALVVASLTPDKIAQTIASLAESPGASKASA